MNEIGNFGGYSLQFVIGTGSYATVYYAIKNGTESVFAIKIFQKKNNFDYQKILTEVNTLRNVHHPCIISLIEVIEDDERLGIVQEFAPNGVLTTLIMQSGIPENHLQNYMVQIMSAIDYLHNYKNVIHRDIKAENILLDQNFQIKLSDFGLSKHLHASNELMHTSVGSPNYAAPELITHSMYTSACDIWSIGVLLYYMATGTLPFQSNNIHKLYNKILSGYVPFNTEINFELRDLISKMLQVNPAQRITIDGIFNHPWVRRAINVNIPPKIMVDPSLTREFTNLVKEEYQKIGIDYDVAMMKVNNNDPCGKGTYSVIIQTVSLKMNCNASKSLKPMARRSLLVVHLDKKYHSDYPIKKNHSTLQAQYDQIKHTLGRRLIHNSLLANGC